MRFLYSGHSQLYLFQKKLMGTGFLQADLNFPSPCTWVYPIANLRTETRPFSSNFQENSYLWTENDSDQSLRIYNIKTEVSVLQLFRMIQQQLMMPLKSTEF